MQPVPILRELVPSATPAQPADATRLDAAIAGSLPFSIPLDATWRITVVAPTGLATTWQDAPASVPIADSLTDALPFDPAANVSPLARVPVRLLVRDATGGSWSVPLTQGTFTCGDLQLSVLNYRVVAGSMREATPGSTLSVAWRSLARGSTTFTEPPVHPYVHPRLPVQRRFLSWIGILIPWKQIPRRFVRRARAFRAC